MFPPYRLGCGCTTSCRRGSWQREKICRGSWMLPSHVRTFVIYHDDLYTACCHVQCRCVSLCQQQQHQLPDHLQCNLQRSQRVFQLFSHLISPLASLCTGRRHARDGCVRRRRRGGLPHRAAGLLHPPPPACLPASSHWKQVLPQISRRRSSYIFVYDDQHDIDLAINAGTRGVNDGIHQIVYPYNTGIFALIL